MSYDNKWWQRDTESILLLYFYDGQTMCHIYKFQIYPRVSLRICPSVSVCHSLLLPYMDKLSGMWEDSWHGRHTSELTKTCCCLTVPTEEIEKLKTLQTRLLFQKYIKCTPLLCWKERTDYNQCILRNEWLLTFDRKMAGRIDGWIKTDRQTDRYITRQEINGETGR